MDGFAIALSEITLVLFTTLAPSGAVAYLLMSLPLVPVALILNALVGGPLIALVGFAAAGRLPLPGALLCTMAAGALVANGVVYGVLAGQLEPLANELASVAQLVPSLPACVAAFAVLGLAGEVAAFCGVRVRNSRRRLVLLTAGAVLALAGIFVMRFVFYMTHLTAGLGV